MARLSTTTTLLVLISLALPHALIGQERSDQKNQTIESEIRTAMRHMRTAAETFDADALYAHVLDTTTPPIIEDGRLAESWSEALENTRRGLKGIERLSYTYSHESVTVLSDSAALWVGEGNTSATLQDGRQIAAAFAETVVFVSDKNQWKVLHAHRSALRTRRTGMALIRSTDSFPRFDRPILVVDYDDTWPLRPRLQIRARV